MMKEVAVFAVSSSALVYFLSPTSEEPQAVPPEILEEIVHVQAPVENVDDSWGYEDEDEDDNFVFGEPLISDEDDDLDIEDITKTAGLTGKSNDSGKNEITASKMAESIQQNKDSLQKRERRRKNNPALSEIR